MVLMLVSTWLYCATRLARVDCEFGSTTGSPAVRPVNAAPANVAVPVMAPIVAEAALLVVEMLM